MNLKSVKDWKFIGIIFAVLVSAMCLIITSSGVWNGVSRGAVEPFYGWVAGINFIISGGCIAIIFTKVFKKWKSAE